MKYLKLGPIKIPYGVETEGKEKKLKLFGLSIPFSDFEKNGKKYYKIYGISFWIPGQKKMLIPQAAINYQKRDQMDEKARIEVASRMFEEKVGYPLNLEDPKTFNEKIFWLKFYYHDPLITRCCDKYAVKDYVTEKIGPGRVVPTIRTWERPEDIDLSGLPDRYVVKVNWSSGYNIIVKDRTKADEKAICEKLAYWMRPEQNSYYQSFNWGYKDMKPVAYAEEYMEQIDGQLYDYKFYCCKGQIKYFMIATDRAQEGQLTYNYFDMDFNPMDLFSGTGKHTQVKLEKPRFFDEMVKTAEILSEPFPFVRVDFYETSEGYYVGEMTFYCGGGLLKIQPLEWAYKLGSYIELPEKRV